MKLFAQVVRTVVNVSQLPLDVAKDAVTLGGALNEHGSYTIQRLEKIAKDAAEEPEED